MVYATFATHLLPALHYVIAFVILFVLLPKWLFPNDFEDMTERIIISYSRMVFMLIVIGYLFVLFKIYEVLSLLLLFLVLGLYRFVEREKKSLVSLKNHLVKKTLILLDSIATISFKKLRTNITNAIRKNKRNIFVTRHRFSLIESMLLIGSSSFLMYLCFYDAFTSAAPPLSDSYVTLAWMKYIDARQLFNDGIYPQGFHIYLATLFKFAAVDAYYVLRYTGPLNALFYAFGMYLITRKLTGSAAGALVSLIVILVFWNSPSISPVTVDRLAATNSQEFAFIFVFPAIYFICKYVIEKQRKYLIAGMTCTTIIGFVHIFAFGFVGLLIVTLVLSASLTLKNRWLYFSKVLYSSIGAVGLSLIPLGIGLFKGYTVHSSSASYLFDRKVAVYQYAELSVVDSTVLCFVALLLLTIISRKSSERERFLALFTVLATISVFLLYWGGAAWTQSTLIASRSIELWGLLVPFSIGMTFSLLFKWLKNKWEQMMYAAILAAVLISLITIGLHPIVPYKMEHGENIEQYFSIRNEHLPKTWMIVSQAEGYAVVLGTGFHMHLGDFLQLYKAEEKLVKKELAQDIFIFKEKNIFQVNQSNDIYTRLAPIYERRKEEYDALEEWISVKQDAGSDLTIYFENENIQVFHYRPFGKIDGKTDYWKR